MTQIENRWTVGNIAQLAGLVGTIIAVGIAIGVFNTRLDYVERIAAQSINDSRTLIELRTDVAYIRRSLDRIEGSQTVFSSDHECPDTQPVLVASYCRAAPISSSSQDR